jgi:tryptophanyl-tRNA synthetase
VLVEAEALIPKTARLPGTNGDAKMSKSLGNCIYLKDSADEIAKKVKGMKTDPSHLRVEDPGNPDANPVFTYLDAFDPDISKVAELKAWYAKGGLGDAVLKKRLGEILQDLLAPVRTRREELAQDPAAVLQILLKGSVKAAARAEKTLHQMKRAMCLDYISP